MTNKWRITYYNKDTDTLMEKEFKNYQGIKNDEFYSTIIRNKDHFHNIFKRLKNKFKNKNIIIKKLV